MVEFAIILPVYVALVFGVLFLGDATLLKQELHQVAAFLAAKPGVQSSDDLDPDLFVEFEGELALLDDQEETDVYDEEDIIDCLERESTGAFSVQFRLGPGGTLEPVITGGVQTQEGGYIEQHGLLDEPNPALCADLLNEWIAHCTAKADYTYSPFFMRTLFEKFADRKDERGGDSSHERRMIADGLTIKAEMVASGRGPKERELTAEGCNHPVEKDLLEFILPDYPNFQGEIAPFWGTN